MSSEGPSGAFPPPPTQDPAVALHDSAVAALQRLHNYLAVNRPKALAAMGPPLEQDLVTLTIVLLNRLPGER